jgi:tetratricopeptide (TPR) repeat protein
MNHSEADIALVEKYFDAELNDAELKTFTTRLESDENFKLLVEQEKALIAAVRYEGAAANLQYLEDLESKLQKETPIRLSSGPTKWYYYAAAAVVGITVVVAVFMNSFKENPDQLFQAYFAPYPNMFEPGLRSNLFRSDQPIDSKRAEAFQAYEQGNYQKAATLFTDLLKDNKDAGMLLLLGNSNLILGNLEEAKDNFITLNRDFDGLDMPAKWYLNLTYLKIGETEKAQAILTELGATESSYAAKARELLAKVN